MNLTVWIKDDGSQPLVPDKGGGAGSGGTTPIPDKQHSEEDPTQLILLSLAIFTALSVVLSLVVYGAFKYKKKIAASIKCGQLWHRLKVLVCVSVMCAVRVVRCVSCGACRAVRVVRCGACDEA